MLSRLRNPGIVLTGLLLPFMMAGCPFDLDDLIDDVGDILEDIEIEIERTVGDIQDRDVVIIPDRDIIIVDDADIIVDISDDLDGVVLDDITVLVFDNFTPFDIYIEYFIDEFTFQSAFVLAGEALVIEYPCLFDIELTLEEDYDPFTGELLDVFPLSGAFVENGIDFFCGEAVIVEIDEFEIIFSPESIDF